MEAVDIRQVQWPRDVEAIAGMDLTFDTEVTYSVASVWPEALLLERSALPTLEKDYGPVDFDELRQMDAVLLAESAGALVGWAALRLERWNRRAVIQHLYVAPEQRGRGCGKTLLAALEAEARRLGAWCLWLETQNVNAPAIEFYRSQGFHWCGFDTALYDPEGTGGGEVALFFTRPIL